MPQQNFKPKKYQGIPKVQMTEQQFKERILLSYQTQKGVFLSKMNKTDFDNWIGRENVKDRKLKVYRGVPNNINDLRNGDFCTTSELYALKYGKKVITMLVPLSKLKYVMGHKNGNPESVAVMDKGVQPVELIYVDKVDKFSDAFKSFEYKKYLEFLVS